MELFKVVSVEATRQIIKDNFSYELGCESVSIAEAVGRICFSDIKSNMNIPAFRRSTVDGFAVNSKDVFGASEAMPSMMDLKAEILMGKTPPSRIASRGECLYIPTGGMLPDGADSVVMIEYTDKLDEKTILINSPSAPGDNVIQVGEDIRLDDTVIKRGKKLRPYEIGVLAALGVKTVEVYKKIRIAIISTGDEIVDCDSEPKLGEIRDINTYLLSAAVLEDGAIPVCYGIIKDDFQLLKDAVDKALSECDIVLISGGSSVGKKDQTLKVIDSYEDGGSLVHGIAVKPGKPTLIGNAGGKAIFGLPGHPLAASIIYKILVKSLMDNAMGHMEADYGISAVMSINYHKAKGREEYLPVSLEIVDGKLTAKPVFGKSGLISVFSRAWGYVKIDKNLEGLRSGDIVTVYRF